MDDGLRDYADWLYRNPEEAGRLADAFREAVLGTVIETEAFKDRLRKRFAAEVGRLEYAKHGRLSEDSKEFGWFLVFHRRGDAFVIHSLFVEVPFREAASDATLAKLVAAAKQL